MGAVWAVFFLFVPCLIYGFRAARLPFGEFGGPPRRLMALKIFLVAIAAMGATAPLGVTVCGWVAVTSIRRSARRLYGMGLALFDGLVFPLLMLDGIILGAFVTLSGLLVDFYSMPPGVGQRPSGVLTGLANALLIHPRAATFIGVAACIVVDFLIVRACWQAVHRPPKAIAGTVGDGRRVGRILPGVVVAAIVVVSILVALFGVVALLYAAAGPARPLPPPGRWREPGIEQIEPTPPDDVEVTVPDRGAAADGR